MAYKIKFRKEPKPFTAWIVKFKGDEIPKRCVQAFWLTEKKANEYLEEHVFPDFYEVVKVKITPQ